MEKIEKTPETEACLINTLPDEVVCVILSSLTLKEAGRSSVLSRRWRYLWRFTSGPNLVFELHQKIQNKKAAWRFTSGPNLVFELHQKIQNKKAADQYREFYKWNELVTEFVNSVNRVMILHKGTFIDKLIIRFSSIRGPQMLVNAHGSFINPICDWIRFAMKKQVSVLELASSGDNKPPNQFERLLLLLGQHQHLIDGVTDKFFQAFVHYDFPNLNQFLSISREVDPVVSLKSFRLVNITIKGEVIEYLLSHLPCLEELYIKGGVPDLTHLNVVSASLKSLGLCDFWNLKNLKISAENLVSFECMGKSEMEVKFCFENVPQLSEVIMNGGYMQSFINKKHLHEMYYNQLEKLTLDLPTQGFDRFSPVSIYDNLPRLNGVKQLELVIAVRPDQNLIVYLIWAMVCPSLSTFSIKFYDATNKKLLGRPPKTALKVHDSYQQKHLKLVKLIDFASHPNYVEFALKLLQVAKSLEKLIVKPENDLQRVAITENHAQRLEANLPVGAELVIQ